MEMGTGGDEAVPPLPRLSVHERCAVEIAHPAASFRHDEIARRQSLRELAVDVSSLDEVLGDLPALVVDRRAAERVCHGAPIGWSNVLSVKDGEIQRETEMPVRLHDDNGRLLAVGRLSPQGVDRITIEKVLVTDLR